MQHHVFVSYARADNGPRNEAGEGRIQRFARDLIARHCARTGRTLKVFTDTERIENGDRWEKQIQHHLRQSRVLAIAPFAAANPAAFGGLASHLTQDRAAAQAARP